MNDQVSMLDIPYCINKVMRTVCMEEELREVHDGVNMSYNFIGKYIGYDEERLKTAYVAIAPFCSFEDYVQTITLHELGHAVDLPALEASLTRTVEIFTMKKSYTFDEIYHTPALLKMLIEEDEMNLAFEITAWENAAQLNEQFQLVGAVEFQTIKNHSLASYDEVYQQDLQSYQELTNKNSVN